jgi:hypothetical protein
VPRRSKREGHQVILIESGLLPCGSEYPLLAVGGTSHSTCCSSTVAHLFSRKLVAVTACTPSPYWVIDHATRVILRTRPRLPFSDSSQTNS